MTLYPKDQIRGKEFLSKQQLSLQDIKAFHFMERHRDKKTGKESYGAGILTLYLNDGTERAFTMRPRHYPSSIVRYLKAKGIAFGNYHRPWSIQRPATHIYYRRPSLYMLWFFILFIASSVMGYHLLTVDNVWGIPASLVFFGISLYLICMLLTRFCYVTMDKEAMIVHSVGRSVRYPYGELMKVNFEFARELAFTHVMEVMDKDYHYRLFYIGRTSRKSLPEITLRLQQAGIDATCSLNPNKRYYEDKHLYR